MLPLTPKKLLPWLEDDTLALQALSSHDKSALLERIRTCFVVPEKKTDDDLFRTIMSYIVSPKCPEKVADAAKSFKKTRDRNRTQRRHANIKAYGKKSQTSLDDATLQIPITQPDSQPPH